MRRTPSVSSLWLALLASPLFLHQAMAAEVRELAATARAIAELPAKLKDVLILCTVEGLSQQEAAMTLGISVKAVETRLSRAPLSVSFWVKSPSPESSGLVNGSARSAVAAAHRRDRGAAGGGGIAARDGVRLAHGRRRSHRRVRECDGGPEHGA